jgi:hypothetical protein
MRCLDVLTAAGLAIALCSSCSSRSDSAFAPGGEDAGDAATDSGLATDSTTIPDTTAPGLDAALEASGPTAQVRVANWVPDAPASGYDVCVAVHGSSSWSGPLLAQMIGDAGVLGDAAAPSIQFPGVTNYLFAVAPARYDLAVVADGAGCASPAKVATDLPALVAGHWYTMAIVGDATPAGTDPGLTIVVLRDDSTNAVGPAVRFLNVAPSIASADFGLGTFASGFMPLEVGVPFAGIATMGAGDSGVAPDSNGYVGVPSAATGTVTFSAHVSTGATGDLAVAPGLTLSPAPTATVALVGGKTGGGGVQLLVCTWDGVQDESSGLVESCSVGGM